MSFSIGALHRLVKKACEKKPLFGEMIVSKRNSTFYDSRKYDILVYNLLETDVIINKEKFRKTRTGSA